MARSLEIGAICESKPVDLITRFKIDLFLYFFFFCFSFPFAHTWWSIRCVVVSYCFFSSILSFFTIIRHTRTRIQKVLGCICVGIIAYYFNDKRRSPPSELFFYLMVVTFLICTTILLISCLFSWSTGGIISKTIYVSRKRIKCAIWRLRDKWILNFYFLTDFCHFKK